MKYQVLRSECHCSHSALNQGTYDSASVNDGFAVKKTEEQ